MILNIVMLTKNEHDQRHAGPEISTHIYPFAFDEETEFSNKRSFAVLNQLYQVIFRDCRLQADSGNDSELFVCHQQQPSTNPRCLGRFRIRLARLSWVEIFRLLENFNCLTWKHTHLEQLIESAFESCLPRRNSLFCCRVNLLIPRPDFVRSRKGIFLIVCAFKTLYGSDDSGLSFHELERNVDFGAEFIGDGTIKVKDFDVNANQFCVVREKT
jgi:hypothetical protein